MLLTAAMTLPLLEMVAAVQLEETKFGKQFDHNTPPSGE
jgi:hypothetical protein